jgi:proteasome assembly chaperone (PAC2) family protein
MSVIYFREPKLEKPVLVASWPGIGNIGMLAVDSLNKLVGGEEFAEIEPTDFFYPKKVIIRNGELKNLEFPTSRFYFKRLKELDLIFFIGEAQPVEGNRTYAEGAKAFKMANMVVDVAVKFGCSRIYTSGAAVTTIHHTHRSKVWAVPNTKRLLDEMRSYKNTILMSDVEERKGQGIITGLNGLLLGVARRRGLDAVCMMGEIPVYLQGFPFPYPKATKSVMEVLTRIFGITIDFLAIDELIDQSESQIEKIFDNFPQEIKEQIEKLKALPEILRDEPEPITEEDKKKILEDIDKLFKQNPKGE